MLKGNPVGSITPAVDIYNAVSLKYALPVGGEDIDTFEGDPAPRHHGGRATPSARSGRTRTIPTLPGELCYRDDAGAVCRCWNWRDGQRTALADDSESAFLIIECVDPSRIDDLRAALDEFSQLIERYLGASIEARAIVDRSNPEVVIVD